MKTMLAKWIGGFAALLFGLNQAFAAQITSTPGDLVQYVCGRASLNFNVTTDQAITISPPSANYRFNAFVFYFSSISLTTAAGGIYPSPAKAGTAIVAAATAYNTLTGATVNNAGSTLNVSGPLTTVYDLSTVYFSLTTPQGAAATASVVIYCNKIQ